MSSADQLPKIDVRRLNANGGTFANGYTGNTLLERNRRCVDGCATDESEENAMTSRLSNQALELQNRVNSLEKELETCRATVLGLQNSEEELRNR